MALCGVRYGRLWCLFKWLVNCVHKACVFLHIWNKWIVVSSSHLQKEHSGEFILLNSHNFLFMYKTLCNILYWNIRILESVVTILVYYSSYYSSFCSTSFFSKVVSASWCSCVEASGRSCCSLFAFYSVRGCCFSSPSPDRQPSWKVCLLWHCRRKNLPLEE